MELDDLRGAGGLHEEHEAGGKSAVGLQVCILGTGGKEKDELGRLYLIPCSLRRLYINLLYTRFNAHQATHTAIPFLSTDTS